MMGGVGICDDLRRVCWVGGMAESGRRKVAARSDEGIFGGRV